MEMYIVGVARRSGSWDITKEARAILDELYDKEYAEITRRIGLSNRDYKADESSFFILCETKHLDIIKEKLQKITNDYDFYICDELPLWNSGVERYTKYDYNLELRNYGYDSKEGTIDVNKLRELKKLF